MLLWHYFEQKNVCDMFLYSKNSYLYTMNNPLRRLGNIPVTVSALESLFPHIKRGNQKVRLLERDKQIIRLKRGLYVCNPEITGKILSTELIANSSLCTFVCFHVIGPALLRLDTGNGVHEAINDSEAF